MRIGQGLYFKDFSKLFFQEIIVAKISPNLIIHYLDNEYIYNPEENLKIEKNSPNISKGFLFNLIKLNLKK